MLSIAAAKVRSVAMVDVLNEAAAVAFMPNGRRAFVAKYKSARVGVLAIDATLGRHETANDMPSVPESTGSTSRPTGRWSDILNESKEPCAQISTVSYELMVDTRTSSITAKLVIRQDP